MTDISILLLAFTVFFVMGYTTTTSLLVEIDDGVAKDADRSTGIETGILRQSNILNSDIIRA